MHEVSTFQDEPQGSHPSAVRLADPEKNSTMDGKGTHPKLWDFFVNQTSEFNLKGYGRLPGAGVN